MVSSLWTGTNSTTFDESWSIAFHQGMIGFYCIFKISCLHLHFINLVIFQGPDGETAIHLAASGGHIDIIRLLMSAGANVNEVDDVLEI